VQESLIVDTFESLYHVIANHQHSLERELSFAVVKQVFE